jgi:membrane protease subunit (stomatin/prohibitin family)
MGDPIRFVRNHHDHSTDKGFQFEFICDRCQSGFRTRFQATLSGTVSGILDTAGGLLGGLFGSAARVSDTMRSASYRSDHDKAFEKAVEEIMPEFVLCPRCSHWVCRAACWSEKRGLCKDCAPDLGVEMAAAQADKSREEIWRHAKMAEEDKHLTEADWRQGVRAACPKCEKPLASNTKFCPECGERIQSAKHCTQCGAKLQPAAKFCPECGTKTE